MEGSRAINGVQHPLHRQSLRSLPAHPRVRSSWAPSSQGGLVWGHSSRRVAFGGVYGDTPLAALLSEGCMGTLLSPRCFRRGVWGHPLAALLSEGCPHIISGQPGSDCIPIVFPTREKRSLIPPCGPSRASRNCQIVANSGIRRTSRATGSAACRHTRREGRL